MAGSRAASSRTSAREATARRALSFRLFWNEACICGPESPAKSLPSTATMTSPGAGTAPAPPLYLNREAKLAVLEGQPSTSSGIYSKALLSEGALAPPLRQLRSYLCYRRLPLVHVVAQAEDPHLVDEAISLALKVLAGLEGANNGAMCCTNVALAGAFGPAFALGFS
eukprot:CAMPEP_0170616830 /NCGR_PEP_ID=MMETSP0224-20130122/26076_1 /TAXON_ID=285029 /ORGANISM="Togula jolla, Strain CCCM 725" /LENGTH=167 /DNA_ID=CAMNT_0010942647 /DNA_START=459 /DNA_END=959 /DNA_ORIENTATION=+